MAGKYFWHVVANIDTEYDSVKAYWGSIGKWAGKQSDKQKKKIARVKEILAE